ncbi:MAG: amidase, partial [Gammaproteobacteria bacterium]
MTPRIAGRILVTALLLAPLAARAESDDDFPFLEATVAQLQAQMAAGRLTSEQLTRAYIERIGKLDSSGPGVNAVIELNPDALALARNADALRRQGKVLGP